jgi:hypothetical protein
MAWTDISDYVATDGFSNTDVNTILENEKVLHKGNGFASIGSVAAASSFDIGTEHQTIIVSLSANSSIDFISTTDRQPGNVINLINLSISSYWCNLKNQTASPPANYAAIVAYTRGTGMADVLLEAGMFVSLVYSGTYWYVSV